jgi:peroxiredoxin
VSIYQAYADQGVRVYAISNEPSEPLIKFRDELGLTLPILLDVGDEVRRKYGLQFPFPTGAYPQDFVIGIDGTVVYQNNRYEAAGMIAAIEAELAKQ